MLAWGEYTRLSRLIKLNIHIKYILWSGGLKMTYENIQMFDLHTHHKRCGHAKGEIRDYIEMAIQNGLDIIGISDHSPYFYRDEDHFRPNITMRKSEFAEYVEEVLALKKEYEDKIAVLLGVESDFFPEHMKHYQTQYQQYPFDYIIGSVHYVDGISIFNKNRWEGLTDDEKIATKDAYYKLIQQSAQSGMFEILGHIDAMKGFYPEFSEIPSTMVEQTLKVIGEENVAIEINTSGRTKYCGGWYPAEDILEKALFYNVDVTFGSDAHTPERIGEDFHLVKAKLKEIGFEKWCVFRQKEKIYVPL